MIDAQVYLSIIGSNDMIKKKLPNNLKYLLVDTFNPESIDFSNLQHLTLQGWDNITHIPDNLRYLFYKSNHRFDSDWFSNNYNNIFRLGFFIMIDHYKIYLILNYHVILYISLSNTLIVQNLNIPHLIGILTMQPFLKNLFKHPLILRFFALINTFQLNYYYYYANQ